MNIFLVTNHEGTLLDPVFRYHPTCSTKSSKVKKKKKSKSKKLPFQLLLNQFRSEEFTLEINSCVRIQSHDGYSSGQNYSKDQTSKEWTFRLDKLWKEIDTLSLKCLSQFEVGPKPRINKKQKKVCRNRQDRLIIATTGNNSTNRLAILNYKDKISINLRFIDRYVALNFPLPE